MDSVTQIALGSAVGYAVLGNKLGRRAALYGALLGTLPDLDVLIPYGGPVENFTYHRGFSHSLLVQLVFSVSLAWLATKTHVARAISFRRWFGAIYLILVTHALLDSFTVYGTQLFWPLTEYPVSISTLFIIDPLYTLPLLVGLIGYCIPALSPNTHMRLTKTGLILSSLYLMWSLGAKLHIDNINEAVIAKHGLPEQGYMSTPAPMTTFLWRSVVVQDDRYFEIYTSVFDSVDDVSVYSYDNDAELLSSLQDNWNVQRLTWFTHGSYAVNNINNEVIISDLRMGVADSYVFAFKVADIDNGKVIATKARQDQARPDINGLPLFLARITNPAIDLSASARESDLKK